MLAAVNLEFHLGNELTFESVTLGLPAISRTRSAR